MKESRSNSTAWVRNGILALLLVAVFLVVHNIFSQNGILALRKEQKEAQTIQRQIQDLKQENERLGKENQALKSDPAAIERVAREQMHLAKPGEKIYTLAPKGKPAK
jgi:cell division protein FtsB